MLTSVNDVRYRDSVIYLGMVTRVKPKSNELQSSEARVGTRNSAGNKPLFSTIARYVARSNDVLTADTDVSWYSIHSD